MAIGPFTPGDKLSAADMNAVAQAVAKIGNLRGDKFIQVSHTATGITLRLATTDLPAYLPRTAREVLFVKNSSGADCNRFNILGIDAPVTSPTENLESFKDQVALKGIRPTEADHLGRFAILLESAKNDTIVTGLLSGVAPVRIRILADWHRYADVNTEPAGSIDHLDSAEKGAAFILWREEVPLGETAWAIVRLSGPEADVSVPGTPGDQIIRFEAHYARNDAVGEQTTTIFTHPACGRSYLELWIQLRECDLEEEEEESEHPAYLSYEPMPQPFPSAVPPYLIIQTFLVAGSNTWYDMTSAVTVIDDGGNVGLPDALIIEFRVSAADTLEVRLRDSGAYERHYMIVGWARLVTYPAIEAMPKLGSGW